MKGNVFQRYEKKYMLTYKQYEALTQCFEGRMKPNMYGTYTISNLYYDTDRFDLARMSMDKPVYREKLRIRSYGAAKDEDSVFLELKKKYDGVVYKRRTKLSYGEAKSFLEGENRSGGDAQIMREIGYFLRMYPIKPKAFLCYDRAAFAGVEDGELRVTFDTNIRFRRTELSLDKGNWGERILEPGKVLMEVKVRDSFPLWLCRALSELEAYPTSFSKYRTCYSRYLADSIFTGEAVYSA